MSILTGKRVLVTGGTSGIGLAIAETLGGAGSEVVINGLGDAASVEAACARILEAGARSVSHDGTDLRDVAAIEAMMQRQLQAGGVDVLVNSAGVQFTAAVEQMPPERWDALIAINLSASFHTMRFALPGMAERGYGRVLNIASVHGLVASLNKAPYVASKFGLVGLSKVAALEYAQAGDRASGGVTVNCVCPGWVETPLIEPQIAARAAAAGGSREAGVRDLLREKQPSQRMSLPEDIAALCLWLCQREAHNLTGAALPVDGGWTAQ